MTIDATASGSEERSLVQPPKKLPSTLRRRGFLARNWAWVVVAAVAIAILILQVLKPLLDEAYVNIGILVLACVGIGTLVWRLVGANRKLRLATLAALVLTGVAFAVTFQVRGVWGGLIPTFQFRWQRAPDELLGHLVGDTTADMQSAVDMQTVTPNDFPQFLGPQRNGHLLGPSLARDWSTHAPRELWRQPIGAGWSGFTVVNGFAVTMEQRANEELVTCYEVATGKARWSQGLETRHETILGGIGPRSTPTISGGRVYALGATGVLRCLDGATGKSLWSYDVLRSFGLTPEEDLSAVAWGRSGSPLIVDDLVVIPCGGSAQRHVSLIALRAETGEIAWEGGNRQVSYASPALATLAGIRQILSVNESTVTGHDPATGKTLWEYPWPGQSNAGASVSQPQVVDDDRLLLSKAYGTGAAGLQLVRTDQGQLQVRQLWHDSGLLKTKYTNVCVIQGFAYGLSDGILECVDVATGTRRWKRGRYGHGQVLGVGDVILVQAESGNLAMVEASPLRYQELATLEVLHGKTWNTLCLSGKYLLVRNGEEAACFELPLAPTPP